MGKFKSISHHRKLVYFPAYNTPHTTSLPGFKLNFFQGLLHFIVAIINVWICLEATGYTVYFAPVKRSLQTQNVHIAS